MRNPAGSSNAKGERKGTDPTLYISAFRKGRFYIYSRRQPELSEGGNIRDIINEKPNK
jgi:peptidylprolyl isomerase domain and WD repeat-containing protein 1